MTLSTDAGDQVDQGTIEGVWEKYLRAEGIVGARQVGESRSEGRRTYVLGDRFYKVHIPELETKIRQRSNPRDYRREFEIMKRCSGLPGILPILECRVSERCHILVFPYVKGKSLHQTTTGIGKALCVLTKVLPIVIRLSLRGVAHNDLGRHNILLADDGRVFVIDFDRATRSSRVAALYRNFFRRLGRRGPLGSIRSVFRYVFRTRRAIT